LDAICYQKDHRPGNYFVNSDENGQYKDICAFDNDCPTTLFPSPNPSFTTYVGVPGVIKNGYIQQPFISERLRNSIQHIDTDTLYTELCRYCSRIEAKMIIVRLSKMKKSINDTVQKGLLRVLKDSEWTANTMRTEIMQYPNGETYFSYFAKKHITI
jgi:hypothetical protein